MLRPGMRFRDSEGNRVLELQIVTDHWKSPAGVCSCGGRECKPNLLSTRGPKRVWERGKMRLGWLSACICGNRRCHFLPDGSCACGGAGCPYQPVVIAMQCGGPNSGTPVAMPAMRFVGETARYELLV